MYYPNLNKIIRQVLQEDAYQSDITTQLLVPKDKISRGHIQFKEAGVICGLDIVKKVFQILDPKVSFRTPHPDGKFVSKNTKVLFLKGKARALLTAERTALNFLSHLSGIATNTCRFTQKIKRCSTVILDTRKTTPGLRILEKYAVRTGGGVNHRLSLKDMVFIKDNHLRLLKNNLGLSEALKRVRQQTKKPVTLEVENITDLKKSLKMQPDIILLDNMSTEQLKKAVKLTRIVPQNKRPLLEASGGVTIANIEKIAQTGVDRISVGALTHTFKAMNVSMELGE